MERIGFAMRLQPGPRPSTGAGTRPSGRRCSTSCGPPAPTTTRSSCAATTCSATSSSTTSPRSRRTWRRASQRPLAGRDGRPDRPADRPGDRLPPPARRGLPPRLRRQRAVERDPGPVEGGRRIGAEEAHRGGELLRRRPRGVPGVGSVSRACSGSTFFTMRTFAVTPVPGDLLRDRTDECLFGGLGDRICRAAGHGTRGERRRDRDDAPPSSIEHAGQHALDEVQRRPQVGIEQCRDLRRVVVDDRRPARIAADQVGEDVDAAEALDDAIDRRLGVHAVAEVGDDRYPAIVGEAEVPGEGVEARPLPAGQPETGAVRGERGGHGSARVAGRAGDQDDRVAGHRGGGHVGSIGRGGRAVRSCPPAARPRTMLGCRTRETTLTRSPRRRPPSTSRSWPRPRAPRRSGSPISSRARC